MLDIETFLATDPTVGVISLRLLDRFTPGVKEAR